MFDMVNDASAATVISETILALVSRGKQLSQSLLTGFLLYHLREARIKRLRAEFGIYKDIYMYLK